MASKPIIKFLIVTAIILFNAFAPVFAMGLSFPDKAELVENACPDAELPVENSDSESKDDIEETKFDDQFFTNNCIYSIYNISSHLNTGNSKDEGEYCIRINLPPPEFT